MGGWFRRSKSLVCAALALSPATAAWAPQDGGARRAAELRQAWRELRPGAAAPTFDEAPLLAPPYRAGRLSPRDARETLDQIRFARRIAGAPDDLALDDESNRDAQHAAVLLARLGMLDHDPARPGDMPAAFHERARRGAGRSNLALGPRRPADAVRVFLDDVGVPSLGHRRWLLNWRLRQVGVGFSPPREPRGAPVTVVAAMDASRPRGDVAAFTAWPAPPAFPLDWAHPRMDWSVDLAPAYFEAPDPVRLRATLVRESDGKRWSLRPGEGLRATADGYGNGRGLAFAPPEPPRDGEVWRVELDGLRRRDGTAANLVYAVRFFRLDGR